MRPGTAAILLIGNELLTGKIVDENGARTIAALRTAGIDLVELRIVSDDLDAIGEAARELSGRAEFVVSSGGIGPTHDDVTLKAMARGFGVEMVEHPTLRGWIDTYFARRPTELEVWRRMAWLPEGSEIVVEGPLVWPVTRFKNIYVLPGVPQLFENQLRTVLSRHRAEPVRLATLYLSIGEGEIAPALERALELHPAVTLGSYPVWGDTEYRTRVTVESRDQALVDTVTDWLRASLAAAVVRVG
jgi:molybdenum cofactor synthesis domain-containing protein